MGSVSSVGYVGSVRGVGPISFGVGQNSQQKYSRKSQPPDCKWRSKIQI